jgi:hypothetical protein
MDTPQRTPRPPGSPVMLIMPLGLHDRIQRRPVAVRTVLAEARDGAG